MRNKCYPFIAGQYIAHASNAETYVTLALSAIERDDSQEYITFLLENALHWLRKPVQEYYGEHSDETD